MKSFRAQFDWLVHARRAPIAFIGHQCIWCARFADRSSDATAIYPFDFTRLVFAAAIGFAVFGEVPDAWMSYKESAAPSIPQNSRRAPIYIAHRESGLRRTGLADTAQAGRTES